MRKMLMVVLSYFLISSFAFGEWTSVTIYNGAKPGTEPDGFRGIKWGTHISTLKGMEYVRTDPSFGGIKMYRRIGDVLQIGGAKLKKIEYCFWRGRFYSVFVYTSGDVNWLGLKEAVFEKFGKGYQPNEFIERYVWGGTRTGMMLEYNEISEIGRLWMFSIEIDKEIEAYRKQKAKEGAEKGF